jgi:hypothetical protein
MKRMKRVLLLVCLIVSLVELDWERYRIYLLSSMASLSFVLGSELTRRRRVQQVATERPFKTGEGVPSKAYVIESADGAERPFTLTRHAAADAGKDLAADGEKRTKVAIYSTEDAGKGVAHFEKI